jgi:hypothetical protein
MLPFLGLNLRQQLVRYPQIKEVYLAQKVVKYFPEEPFYVFGVKRKSGFLEMALDRQDAKLLHHLVHELKLSSHFYVFICNKNTKHLERNMRKVETDPIYAIAR